MMCAGEAKFTDRGCIGLELVGDDCPRQASIFFRPLAQEPTSRPLAPFRSDEDIADLTVLVHGASQKHPPTIDGVERFAKMPPGMSLTMLARKTFRDL